MIKSFKKYLKENILEDTFNSFVEESFSGGQIDKNKAKVFLNEPDYLYNGDSYRVIWAPTQDIINQKTFKNIARYISNKFLNDPNVYKFFYKTPEDAFASKIYVKNTEEKTGIIFLVEAKNAIDLSKYTGDQDAIKERVEAISPILYFEPLNINTIYGKIVYDQYTDDGWVLYTDEEKDMDSEKEELKNKEDNEVKPEDTEKDNKPKSGISNGTKHSKFPHKSTKENK